MDTRLKMGSPKNARLGQGYFLGKGPQNGWQLKKPPQHREGGFVN